MGPLEFFENENFDAHAPARAAGARIKIWNWTSKIKLDLWLLDLFCPIKKKFPHSTLLLMFYYIFICDVRAHCTVYCTVHELTRCIQFKLNQVCKKKNVYQIMMRRNISIALVLSL